jgi:DNA polymerase-1
MVTHHVCFPGTDKGLDVLASLYCEYYSFWKHEGKEWHDKQDEKVLWFYNCKDCVYTWEIAEALPGVVAQLGLSGPAVNQHRSWWNAFDAMVKGVRMDEKRKKELSTELLLEVTAREEWIAGILGHPVNVRSPKQLKELFYSDLQLPPVLDRKSRQPTTNDEALQKLCRKEPLIRPVVRRIREIRSLGVFRSTFVDGKLDTDGRMRCSYNVAGTETFRFSSSENAFGSGMNLQNVPKGGEFDGDDEDPLVLPNVRSLFLPDEGYEIFDMDLSSADLRVVVWEADEPEMKSMLREGLDPYTEIAKEFYHDPRITKHDPRRQKFKSFAHGTNYLGTARGLATRLGLSIAEAERTQSWYFGKFPRIKIWQDNLRKDLETKRYVRNAFGYRRFFFDRIDGTVYNQAAAWKPQSTVALLINFIWDRIRRAEHEVDILLQVHDSLVGQYPISRAPYFRTRLQDLSLIPIPYDDPLVIPTGFKYSQKSWGACE